MKRSPMPLPSQGLPVRIVIPVVLCVALAAAIPIVSFLKTGFGTSGSSISPAASPVLDMTTPPPAVAQALTELRTRIARNPRDVDALSSLAGLYAQIGQVGAAASLEGRAVAAAPWDASLRLADAALLRAAGRPREAVTQLDAVLAAEPRNVDALYERATIEAGLRERAAARQDMRRFLAVAPRTDARRAMLREPGR